MSNLRERYKNTISSENANSVSARERYNALKVVEKANDELKPIVEYVNSVGSSTISIDANTDGALDVRDLVRVKKTSSQADSNAETVNKIYSAYETLDRYAKQRGDTTKEYENNLKILENLKNIVNEESAIYENQQNNISQNLISQPDITYPKAFDGKKNIELHNEIEKLKTTIPSKFYDAEYAKRKNLQSDNIPLSDKIKIDSAKKKLATGNDLTLDERAMVSKYGINNLLPNTTNGFFDLFAEDNPSNVARFEKIQKIRSKEEKGEVLSEEEKDTVETVKLINTFKKSYRADKSVITTDVNQNRMNAETLKAMQLYNDTAYNENEFNIGTKSFKVDENDKLSQLMGKMELAKNRQNLYIAAGLNRFIEGTENAWDILFTDTTAKEIAAKPDSAYSIASAALRSHYTDNHEQLNIMAQDIVTNVANNIVPMIISAATAGVGMAVGASATAVNVATQITSNLAFAGACFGNSYKEGASLVDNPKDNKVLLYALSTTAAEVTLNLLFEAATYGGAKMAGYKGPKNITSNLISKVSSKFKSSFAKAATHWVGSASGELPEEMGQAILSPILQKYILGADVETIFDDFFGQLSSAAYEGFIGFSSGLLMGISNAQGGFNEAYLQKTGNKYNGIFDISGIDVNNIAQYFLETVEKNGDLYKVAKKVKNGDKSDIAVGTMMNEALKENKSANNIVYAKIGENVKTKENGISDVISEYTRLVESGFIFPSNVNELYNRVKQYLNAGETISNELAGEFALSIQVYTPRALIMREMVKQVELTDRDINYTPEASELEPIDLIGNSNLNARQDSGIINNNDTLTQQNVPKYDEKQRIVAIMRYKSSESYTINAKLRENIDLDEFEQEFVDILDDALKQLPAYEGTVYRNLTFDDFGGQEAFDEFLSQYKPDEVVWYEQFISCSTKIDGYPVEGKHKVSLIIESKSARKVDEYGNNNEREVIYPLYSAFIVDKVDSKGEYPIIYLQEVLNDGYNTIKEQGDAMQHLQESYSKDDNLQGISKRDTLGNTGRTFRSQSSTPTGQRDSLRSEGRQEPVLSTTRQEQSGKQINSDADNSVSGAVDRPAFTEPSSREIYRDGTVEENLLQRNAKQKHITDIAKKLDSDMTIVWVEKNSEKLKGKNGKFVRSTNTMYLAKDVSVVEMYMEVFKHEFVHRLESRGAYKSFKEYLINRSTAFENYVTAQLKLLTGGQEFDGSRDEAISALATHYYNRFVNDNSIAKPTRDKFTMEDAEREMVADFAGEVLFKGKDNRADIAQALSEGDMLTIGSIESSTDALLELANTDRSLFRKIMDAIKEFIRKLSGSPQTKRLVSDLEYIEQRLARVYDSADTKKAANNSGEVKYSIAKDVNGDYVKVDTNQEIFDGKSVKEMQVIARKFIRDNFKGKVLDVGENGKAYVNKHSGEEYSHPANRRMAEDIKESKMRTAPELDNLLSVSKYIEHQQDDGRHPVATGGWDVYSTRFEIAGNMFVGEVKIMITDRGYIFYDVTKIRRTTRNSGLTENNSAAASGNPSIDSITENGTSVNSNSMQESENNSSDESFSLGSPMQRARENLAKYENGQMSREEYLEENDRLWGEANEKYGIMEQGENADAPISTPEAVSDNTENRQFIRTVLETGKLTPEMVENVQAQVLLGEFSYKPLSDEAAMQKADTIVQNGTAESVWEDAVNNGKRLDKTQIAVGERLLVAAINAGDTYNVLKISSELADILTRAGQVVQAARLLKKMTGAGRLVTVQRMVKTLNTNMREKYGYDRPDIKISAKAAERLANAKTEKGLEHAHQEILQEIANQVPVTFMDKWNAWRYFAMLSNPKTHIRNLIGNGIFVPAVRIKDFIASGIESGAAAFGWIDENDRTKSVIIKKEYIEFAKNDGKKDAVKQLLKGNKYNDKSALREKQQIFKTQVLEFLTRFNSNALEMEDMLFKNKHYIHALAGFLQARNVNLKTVSEDVLAEARIYAVNEARKATFNDESALADWVQNFGNKNLATNIMVEGVLPYKRTPINIVKRGVEYSPLRLGKTLTKGVYDVKKGKITPAEFIDGLASGLTGTGIMLAGMFLASIGCISGGEDDDKLSVFEKWLGKLEYAVEFLGKSYTIDWAAPACIPFFIGAEIINTINDGEDFQFSQLGNAVWNSLEPITNLSMLSGIQSVIESTRYAESSQTLAAIAGDALTSYAMQGIPSLMGAVSRTIDSTQRSWYTDKNDKFFDSFSQSVSNNIRSKVPGLSYTQIPKIDPWGREVSRGGVGERILENFVSPGYYSEIEYNDTNEELKRIFVKTGGNVLPKTAAKSFSVNGETKYLTADEYVTYAKAKGEYSFDYIKEFMDSSVYDRLTDDQRAKVIENLYQFANAKAKSTVSDYNPAEVNTYKTVTRWERNGKSAVNYYIANAVD